MPERIVVDQLARVEGEGGLEIVFRDGRVKQVNLRIFEPPRFFEAFLRGRNYAEVPDLTARICGICPVAYQMSSCYAMERIFGVRVEGELRRLRRLLYLAEWIESHALHIFMLHLPDFLGMEDAVQLAGSDPELVQDGLRLKKAGNALLRAVGGREVHPINVRVGGFYRVPTRAELDALLPELRWGLDAIRRRLPRLASLQFPSFDRDYELVAVKHPHEYALCEGKVVSSKGLELNVEDFDRSFEEFQVPHSTALHSRVRGRESYLTGPLARVNLSFEQLSEEAKDAANQIGFSTPCHNPFRSILARAIEVVHAFDEAVQIVRAYTPPKTPMVPFKVCPGTGRGATEAPRGLLYHRYRVDGDGMIEDAKIVPPTSQNLANIEADLFELAPRLMPLDEGAAAWLAEQAVRNYDPCISCSTHWLRLRRIYE